MDPPDWRSFNEDSCEIRDDRETCINNLKLNIHQSKEYRRRLHQVDDSTYTKSPTTKQQRGSLENVSSNPWGENRFQDASSLRRCRSLAITREDIFTNLEISNDRPRRRSQLIPRAKLIDRPSRERRFGSRVASTESLEDPNRKLIKQKSRSTYLVPNQLNRRKEKSYASLNNLNYSPEVNEYDSLDSPFISQTLLNNKLRDSFGESQILSLPNYYPDSRCDTDITDNISMVDKISGESLSSIEERNEKFSLENSDQYHLEDGSIPYDDNIVLTTNRPLYDTFQDNSYSKPRTVRGTATFNKEIETYFKGKPSSLPSYSSSIVNYESSEDRNSSKTSEKQILILEDSISEELHLDQQPQRQFHSSGEFGSEESVLGNYSNIETNPLYGTAEEPVTELHIVSEHKRRSFRTVNENADDETIKTTIEVDYQEITTESEDFKTIVKIDGSDSDLREEETSKETKESKQHSHKYLREFLESQKGSKKPLQNFIAKKLSNLSRKSSKLVESNLRDNTFYSLPDISACDNLKKCDKIDRKLRKYERSYSKSTDAGESRFIVNIGKHLDITANTNIPVDFELKIAKIPKKNRSKKHSHKSEEQFLQAVKSLKRTLTTNRMCEENHNSNKPEVIGITTKSLIDEDNNEFTGEIEIRMDVCHTENEYHEKIDNMRNYWDKMIPNCDNNEQGPINNVEEPTPKCKVVDVQTKVEEVKKKFEPISENVDNLDKPINRIQMAKQLFEPKAPTEKQEKLSPFVKETCSYFENPFFDRENQFESLNPNIVEIIERNETKELTNVQEKSKIQEVKRDSCQKKQHRSVSKSMSITYPEFDHVRYRVVKSDLFQKKIFANCEKESQFDGLMQYLQDYSFQELLIDNNIVIIEPIRTKVVHETSNRLKTPKNITPLLHSKSENTDDNTLRKHFFYHPIRVNKEVNDNELPNPDTVKQVRRFFEGEGVRSPTLKEAEKCIHTINNNNIDPDKDHCSGTDSNSNPSNISDFDPQENLDESINGENCCERQYITEDIMEKIRKYGSTVTYYGGRVLKKQHTNPGLTKVIMEEIEDEEKRSSYCKCKSHFEENGEKEIYQKMKFKLVKSNSCSSRLELVGRQNLKESKLKYLNNKKELIENSKNKNRIILEDKEEDRVPNKETTPTKDEINESIKYQDKVNLENGFMNDRKLTQWGDLKEEKTFASIKFNNKSTQKVKYDYPDFDQLKTKTKVIDEMEFEPYEIA